jgi:putative mRNA 3-end processing factor
VTTFSNFPDLVLPRPEGLYCPAGDFYIDPWRPVDRAVLTHAHSDHARAGHARYLAAAPGLPLLRARLGEVAIQAAEYGETVEIGGVRVSLHPAGHVLGSAQVRLEHRGRVWVVSGDYKLDPDATCAPFEPLRCDAFITESTFGLPIYRWEPAARLHASINEWWAANADQQRASVLYCYALGKAQRILHELDGAIGPIIVHGAVQTVDAAYREAGVRLPDTRLVSEVLDAGSLRRALVLAPPSAQGTTWLRRFGDYTDAFASGWMRLRGARRRRAVDRGFVMSDHADWPSLLTAITATGAERVCVTHGNVAVLVRWLAEQGRDARAYATEFNAQEDEGSEGRGTAAAADADAADTAADAAADAAAAGAAAADATDPSAADREPGV